MVYILLGMQKTLKGCFIDWTLYSNTFPQGAGMRIRTSIRALFKSRGFLRYVPVVVSILMCCNIANQEGSSINVVYDYFALEVGNTWVYIIMDFSPMATDSTIRTVNISGNIDSIWYFNIKDSLFYHENKSWSDSSSPYLTIPEVTISCDTCMRQVESFICIHGLYDQFFGMDTTIAIATGSLNIGDSTYQYYKRTSSEGFGMGWYGVYYVKNIGLEKYINWVHGATWGAGTIMILKSLNGIENDLFSCFDTDIYTGINDQCL